MFSLFSKNGQTDGKKQAIAFVDFEHWYISMDRFYHIRPDIRAWRAHLAENYDIRDIIFFGDFSNPSLRAEIPRIREVTSYIIETQNASDFHKKDYTDFIMLDHIYQRAMTSPELDVYVIFSGDGHFSSVASFLVNRCGKTVAVYGVRDAISMQLRNTATLTVDWPLDAALPHTPRPEGEMHTRRAIPAPAITVAAPPAEQPSPDVRKPSRRAKTAGAKEAAPDADKLIKNTAGKSPAAATASENAPAHRKLRAPSAVQNSDKPAERAGTAGMAKAETAISVAVAAKSPAPDKTAAEGTEPTAPKPRRRGTRGGRGRNSAAKAARAANAANGSDANTPGTAAANAPDANAAARSTAAPGKPQPNAPDAAAHSAPAPGMANKTPNTPNVQNSSNASNAPPAPRAEGNNRRRAAAPPQNNAKPAAQNAAQNAAKSAAQSPVQNAAKSAAQNAAQPRAAKDDNAPALHSRNPALSEDNPLIPYCRELLGHLSFIEKNNRGSQKVFPTFAGTVDSVANYSHSDRDMLSISMRKMIELGYVSEQRRGGGLIKTRALDVNWDKLRADGIFA